MLLFAEEVKHHVHEAVDIFRHFHQNPELGFKETKTTAFIVEKLQSWGLEVTTWDDLTGCCALLNGEQPGGCVALRADIDALPMQEHSYVPYASIVDGVFHGCGHDSHATALLIAAKMLAENKKHLKGSVMFIFQPAEELLTGAKAVVGKGVLENPKPDFIFGMHTYPSQPAGTLLVSAGPVMAAAASYSLEIKGVGGHGAQPHTTKDPVVASAAIITALQTIASRLTPPVDPVVVTVGSIHGGTVGNIIPEKIEMKGTVRAFSKEVFDSLQDTMLQIISGVASAHGVTATLDFMPVCSSILHEAEYVEWVKSPLATVVGEENIIPCTPTMGSEDFSLYLDKVPGIFCFFGTAEPGKGAAPAWHNPAFTVSEQALPVAAAAFAQVAHDWLNK